MKRQRVNLVTWKGREFYFDNDTLESHWGQAPDLGQIPPPIALTCHQTGRRFVFENNKSVWLDEDAVLSPASATELVAPRRIFQSPTSSLERFVFDPATMKSHVLPPQVLCEQTQGDLSSATQFVYGVLFEWYGIDMGTFFPKSIEDVETAFLLPEPKFFTLALLHQGLMLSKDQFTEWKRTWEIDQIKWLGELHVRIQQCLLAPNFANEFGGCVPFAIGNVQSYFSLPASTRVRILLVLGQWMEHSKRVVMSTEAVYRGEQLVSGEEVYWNFAGVAPNRLYLQLADKPQVQWKLLTRTKPELVSKIRSLLAAATVTTPSFAAILQRWVNVLDPPTYCKGCGKQRDPAGPCTHCIGILLPSSPPKHSQDEEDSRLEFASSAETAVLPPQYNETISSLDTGEMQLQSSSSPSTTTPITTIVLMPTPQKATQESSFPSSPILPLLLFPQTSANPNFQPLTQQDDDESDSASQAEQPPATQAPSSVSSSSV
ncbi:hypothetical protein BASA81_015051 [Batrachochytrium salamandrivorans]|nr:hypothetical protein BASA81_015051 [Batrachochytrium salamandrivorans]